MGERGDEAQDLQGRGEAHGYPSHSAEAPRSRESAEVVQSLAEIVQSLAEIVQSLAEIVQSPRRGHV